MRKNAAANAVLAPNLGLYYDRPRLAIPPQGLQDCLNIRIHHGKISSLNLGWTLFGSFSPLNGPVTLIADFVQRSGGQILIFGTTKDLYKYNEGPGTVSFITPRYETGTVDVSAANPAVVTKNAGSPATNWSTNLKAGDQIYFSATGQTNPSATWYTIASVDSDTQLTLSGAVTGTPLTNVAYTGRKLFTAAITDVWSWDVFFNAQPSATDLWFATNGVDKIVKWDGSGTQVSYTTHTFTAKVLGTFRNMMLFGNCTENTGTLKPNSLKNSDVGFPEVMNAGLAGEYVVKDGTDPIDAFGVLGDNLVIYAARTAVLALFTGDDLVFAFRTAIRGFGPFAPRMVANFGDHHEFVSLESLHRFDGVTLQEIGGHVWRQVLQSRDPNRDPLAFSHFDEENGDLIWVVPLTTDANTGSQKTPRVAYPQHYLERVGYSGLVPNLPSHTKREFPFVSSGYFQRQTTLTWDQLTAAWNTYDFAWNSSFWSAAFPFNLVGSEDGKVYTLNTSSTANGTALSQAFAHFGRRATSDGRFRNLVHRVYPFCTPFPQTGTLGVYVYLSDHPSGDATATGPYAFDLSLSGHHFVSVHRRGRFAEVRFQGAAPWEVEGYDWDIKQGGMR